MSIAVTTIKEVISVGLSLHRLYSYRISLQEPHFTHDYTGRSCSSSLYVLLGSAYPIQW
jgi:hypothetical protein